MPSNGDNGRGKGSNPQDPRGRGDDLSPDDDARSSSTASDGDRSSYGQSSAQTAEYGASRGVAGATASVAQRGRTAGPHTGRGPQGYQRSDDRIQEDANDALTHHGDVDATHITVAVANGEVTLTGTVESRAMKRAAEDALVDVRGIRDVHNQIRVASADDDGGATSGPGTKH